VFLRHSVECLVTVSTQVTVVIADGQNDNKTMKLTSDVESLNYSKVGGLDRAVFYVPANTV